jgi:hypothetical protein
MSAPRVSLTNIVSLLISFAVGGALIYYAHGHLEAELARPDRSMVLITVWGLVFVIGILIVPTIRDRVVPAARVGARLVQLGRRATDPTAVIPSDPELEGRNPTDGSGI